MSAPPLLPYDRTPHARMAWLAPAFVVALVLGAGGCQGITPGALTDSVASRPPPAPSDQIALRAYSEMLAPKYAADPDDKVIAMHYARALRGLTQHAQAVAILRRLAVARPHDLDVLAAYGKALADAGHLQEAADVLERSHTPERPNWTVLSAQGSVADQLGNHRDAQAYYASALKIAPNQPDILSNLGLSYALEHRMREAETTLRDAAAQPTADARVRQNLAMVLSMEGKDADAEEVSRRDMAPVDAAENVAGLKQTASGSDTWSRHHATSTRPAPVRTATAEDTEAGAR